MLKMVKNFCRYGSGWIEKIETTPVSFWHILILFYIAVLFRAFLETYANYYNFDRLTGAINTFFHYPFWFGGVFLSAFIIIQLLTKERMEKIIKIGAIFPMIIVLPTILDLIISKGATTPYAYIYGSLKELALAYITYFEIPFNVSIGIRVEIALVLIFIGYYIFHKTRKINYTLYGVVILYTIIFLFGSMPAIIFGAQNLANGNRQVASKFMIDSFFIQEPLLTTADRQASIIDINRSENVIIQNAKTQNDIIFSIVFLIIDVFLIAGAYFLYAPKKFLAIIKNFRYLRITHYYLLMSLGILLGISFSGTALVGSIFDLLFLASSIFAFLFAMFFSIWENDEIDIEIDKISNKKRPLAKEQFSITEWRNIKFLFLFLSLNFAFLAGLYQFIFILLFLAIFHLYSSPPLRLKRFVGISSALMIFNAIIAVWMGFFIASGTENFRDFPFKYIVGIFIIFFLAENIKNIKDIKGDSENGIKTLPVMLGEENGKLAVGALLFLASIVAPFVFLLNIYTFLTAILFGLIFFFLTIKKEFKEWQIFITYFIFIIIGLIEFIIFL